MSRHHDGRHYSCHGAATFPLTTTRYVPSKRAYANKVTCWRITPQDSAHNSPAWAPAASSTQTPAMTPPTTPMLTTWIRETPKTKPTLSPTAFLLPAVAPSLRAQPWIQAPAPAYTGTLEALGVAPQQTLSGISLGHALHVARETPMRKHTLVLTPTPNPRTETDNMQLDAEITAYVTEHGQAKAAEDYAEAYFQARRRFRRFTNRPSRQTRFTRRTHRRKGGSKGKPGSPPRVFMCTPCACHHDSTEAFYQKAGKGPGKGPGKPGKGPSPPRRNPIGADGKVMTCSGCGSEWHFRKHCQKLVLQKGSKGSPHPAPGTMYADQTTFSWYSEDHRQGTTETQIATKTETVAFYIGENPVDIPTLPTTTISMYRPYAPSIPMGHITHDAPHQQQQQQYQQQQQHQQPEMDMTVDDPVNHMLPDTSYGNWPATPVHEQQFEFDTQQQHNTWETSPKCWPIPEEQTLPPRDSPPWLATGTQNNPTVPITRPQNTSPQDSYGFTHQPPTHPYPPLPSYPELTEATRAAPAARGQTAQWAEKSWHAAQATGELQLPNRSSEALSSLTPTLARSESRSTSSITSTVGEAQAAATTAMLLISARRSNAAAPQRTDRMPLLFNLQLGARFMRPQVIQGARQRRPLQCQLPHHLRLRLGPWHIQCRGWNLRHLGAR